MPFKPARKLTEACWESIWEANTAVSSANVAVVFTLSHGKFKMNKEYKTWLSTDTCGIADLYNTILDVLDHI